MKKEVIFKILIFIGIVNALTIVVSALIGQNAYTLANNISEYFNIILCYIPLIFISISILWYIIDLYFKVENRVNYFLLAFIGILSDAVFVIGSFIFAENH